MRNNVHSCKCSQEHSLIVQQQFHKAFSF